MNIISVSNQKGGVGKTTSVINLAYSFNILGFKTLVIDLDPQGNATSGLGEQKNKGFTVRDLLENRFTSKPTQVAENLFLIHASEDLVGFEAEILRNQSGEYLLKNALQGLKQDYKLILIDTPPSTGALLVNALVASNWVLVPVQAEYYALEGLSGLLEIIEFIRDTANSNLLIIGFFITMFDSRTTLSKQVEEELRRNFGELVFDVRIPRSVRVAEAPSFGKPILQYEAQNIAGLAYLNLADRILTKLNLI